MRDEERALVKGLVHVMWADGEVTDHERHLLGGVLTQLGLSDAELTEVSGMMLEPPDLADLREQVPDAGPRREIMKVLLAMAMADGKVELAELRFLNKLARHLMIPDAELERLKTETLEEIEGGLD